MIPAVHPFSAESGPHEIRGHVIIDVNWLDTPNITSCATLSYEGVCNSIRANQEQKKFVVLPSQMRASATDNSADNNTISSCPTLSDEGVCNLPNR